MEEVPHPRNGRANLLNSPRAEVQQEKLVAKVKGTVKEAGETQLALRAVVRSRWADQIRIKASILLEPRTDLLGKGR